MSHIRSAAMPLFIGFGTLNPVVQVELTHPVLKFRFVFPPALPFGGPQGDGLKDRSQNRSSRDDQC